MSGICYLVGTPIGNLKDLTFRALETLKAVDFIFAEDTRHTRILLNTYAIDKPLRSYHKHNERACALEIIKLLEEDKSIALVTDAGMPAISDPGAMLVRCLREHGIAVTSCPSATAATTAAALSGLSERGFAFYGFLPPKNKARDELIEEFRALSVPVILYLAPHDVQNDLAYLFSKLGARQVFIIKELTKLFETAYEGVLGEVTIEEPRGEFVIIIAPQERADYSELSIIDHYNQKLAEGEDEKTALKSVAKERGVHKSEIYKEVLAQKGKN